MIQLADVETQLAQLAASTEDLRVSGARMLADEGKPAAEVITWLIRHGATGNDARNLCVDIVRERRAARVDR